MVIEFQRGISSFKDHKSGRIRHMTSSYHLSARSIHAPLISHMVVLLLVAASCVSAFDTTFYLDGIGYREQELQVSKGTKFQSESPTGVPYASFGGGTNIFVKGVGLAENPQSNDVILYS